MSEEQKHSHHEITYTVNGEEERTKEDQMAVRTILTSAGFTPVEDYVLSSENPRTDFDSEYDRVIHVHQGERFEAKFKGPTPTS